MTLTKDQRERIVARLEQESETTLAMILRSAASFLDWLASAVDIAYDTWQRIHSVAQDLWQQLRAIFR